MQKKTTNLIIVFVAILVLIGAVLIIAFSGGAKNEPSSEAETSSSDASVSEISVEENVSGSLEIPDVTVPEPVSGDPDDVTANDSILTLPDANETGAKETNESEVPREPAGETAAPVVITIPDDDEGAGSGNNENPPDAYDCGTPGHHCDGPETHAYVLNLELKGCPYCGEHDCPSFYAVDEWGNTCYTPGKCPKYDVRKDPVYYCQTCGKKCGDGRNGTCVQFVNACNCPNCGELVEAWTCHTCE